MDNHFEEISPGIFVARTAVPFRDALIASDSSRLKRGFAKFVATHSESIGKDAECKGSPCQDGCLIAEARGAQYACSQHQCPYGESASSPVIRSSDTAKTLRQARSVLRDWATHYAQWSEAMPVAMQNKLPPGGHVRALEDIAIALGEQP